MSTSLLEKIKADAAAEVAAIEAAAKKEAVAQQTATEKEVTQLREQAATALEKEKAKRELVVRSKAKQAHNIALQTAKRDAINAVFADAFAALTKEGSDEYVTRYTKLWQETIPTGESVTAVTAPASRQNETNSLLKSVNITVEPVFVETISAGMVVTTGAGVYDLTLDRRFAEARPELEMQVVKALAN